MTDVSVGTGGATSDAGHVASTDEHYDEIHPELGRIVTTWGRAEFLLMRTLALLAHTNESTGYLLVGDLTAGRAIDKVRWLAKATLAPDLAEQAEEALVAVKKALDARNKALHSAWALQKTEGEWKPARIEVTAKKGVVRLDSEIVTAAQVRDIHTTVAAGLRAIGQFYDVILELRRP